MVKAEPKYEILAGQVKLTILKSEKGQTLLALERIYKDKETGKWKHTNYFNKRDIQNLIAVLSKFLVLSANMKEIKPKPKEDKLQIQETRMW